MYNNCNICNKTFATKDSYNRHINSKDIHKIYQEHVKKYICNCGKMYLHRQSLAKHKQKCTEIKSRIEYIQREPQIDTIVDTELLLQKQFEKEKEQLLEQFEKEKEQLKKKVEKEKEQLLEQLQKDKEELQKQVETEKLRNTNNIDTQNNNNLNIQINAFGCENLEYITEEFKLKCVKQIYQSIPEMVIKIHFNTKYPENHNVKIPNKKLSHASIMTADNMWKTVDKKTTITSMVDKSFNLLDDTYEEHKSQLSEIKRKNYEKYQEKYWKNDKQLHKQLETDVECLVLDGTR